LRKALGAECSAAEAARVLRPAIIQFHQTMRRMQMAKMSAPETPRTDTPAVVLPYRPAAAAHKATMKKRAAAHPRVAAAR
jgi:hypothetical protein